MTHNQDAVSRGRRQQILEAFRDAEKPVLTTTEVHEAVGGVTLETIRSDLKQMQGEQVDGRATTQDFVWWVPQDSLRREEGETGVATGDELRRLVASVVVERLDMRVLFLSLSLLTLNSFLGVGIYLMLQFDTWLLPVSERTAIIYTYVPMVMLGMVIAVSGVLVLARTRL